MKGRRITINKLPVTVDQNWTVCANQMKLTKTETLILAIRQHLIKEGFNPDKRPIIKIDY